MFITVQVRAYKHRLGLIFWCYCGCSALRDKAIIFARSYREESNLHLSWNSCANVSLRVTITPVL